MGMIGKLIGGAIGFVLGGPLGAVLGAVFGHAYDSSKQLDGRDYRRTTKIGYGYKERSQLTFFTATFSMLAKIANCDGQVRRSEVAAVERFIARDLQLAPDSRRVAMDMFLAAMNAPESFQDYAMQFYGEFADQPQMLEVMVDILFRVSVADGTISENEEFLIRTAARIFRLSADQYDRLKSRYAPASAASDTDRYYAILKCKPTDTMDTIKSSYRRLVSEYHPDKIASKGLPEDFTRFANQRFREIHEAYGIIKKARGIK